jgi:glycosyltransferase involved in cell wall biosynthesis
VRILYFHQHFTTPAGSGGTRSYEFARALVARGHKVTIVCGQGKGGGLGLPKDEKRNWHRGPVDGIDVIALALAYSNRDSLLRRTLVFLRFAWRSIWIALRTDCDLIFATSTPLTAGLPGIVSKLLRPRIPFVFEVRDLWPELPRALGMKNPLLLWGMGALEWAAYRSADSCVGLSPGIVEGIRRRARAGLRIEMIPNGCDVGLFVPGNRRALDLPGVRPGDFTAGFIGAHGIANGLDAVLDAAAELKRAGRDDIKLVLIGDGNRKDALVSRAKAQGLDNCLFFPPMKKTEIARVTSGFGCGLMILADIPAFYYGTSPNKFFDYLAAGLPVVNNYPGWLADLISAHRCGVAVPPNDPARLAAALAGLADDPAAASEMGRNSRALAEGEFSRAALATDFADFLENNISSRKLRDY